MNKVIKDMKVEGMSIGMIIIIIEYMQVEADYLGIRKIDHDDQSSATRVLRLGKSQVTTVRDSPQ